jgi:hypothetical protein
MAHTWLDRRVKHLELVMVVPQSTELVNQAIERVGMQARARLAACLSRSDPPVVDATQADADRVVIERWCASNGVSAAWKSAGDRLRTRIERLAARYSAEAEQG